MEGVLAVLLLIRQQYENLTESEKKVAEYILAHSESIADMRIHELASKTGVANSAVIRFCKSLGFSGYSQFKYQLTAEKAKAPDTYMLPAIRPGDGIAEIFNKIFVSNIHSLYAAIQHIDMERATRAVELMKQARQILVLGTGTSEPAASGAVYQLMQFGYSSFCATNGITMRTAALNLQKEDVAIAISYCGHTRDTVESLQLAHQTGASCIALTSYEDAPLCKHADVVLYAPPENIPYMSDGAITSTRNALVCILDSLIISLACQDYHQSIAKIQMRNTLIFPNVRE